MKKYFFIFIVAFFASCSPVEQDVIITIDTETVLNDCYIGNGRNGILINWIMAKVN